MAALKEEDAATEADAKVLAIVVRAVTEEEAQPEE